MSSPDSPTAAPTCIADTKYKYLQIFMDDDPLPEVKHHQHIDVTIANLQLLKELDPDGAPQLVREQGTDKLALDERLFKSFRRWQSGDSYETSMGTIERTYRNAIHFIMQEVDGKAEKPETEQVQRLRELLPDAIVGTKALAAAYAKQWFKAHAVEAFRVLADEMEAHSKLAAYDLNLVLPDEATMQRVDELAVSTLSASMLAAEEAGEDIASITAPAEDRISKLSSSGSSDDYAVDPRLTQSALPATGRSGRRHRDQHVVPLATPLVPLEGAMHPVPDPKPIVTGPHTATVEYLQQPPTSLAVEVRPNPAFDPRGNGAFPPPPPQDVVPPPLQSLPPAPPVGATEVAPFPVNFPPPPPLPSWPSSTEGSTSGSDCDSATTVEESSEEVELRALFSSVEEGSSDYGTMPPSQSSSSASASSSEEEASRLAKTSRLQGPNTQSFRPEGFDKWAQQWSGHSTSVAGGQVVHPGIRAVQAASRTSGTEAIMPDTQQTLIDDLD